jgi:hypothetical protein
MDWDTFYREVYDGEKPDYGAHGCIQWKGTDVCIDIHCICGACAHVDADFFHYYECPACHKRYAVGTVVNLIPLDIAQGLYVQNETNGFHSAADWRK